MIAAQGSPKAAPDQAGDPAPGGSQPNRKNIIPLYNFAPKITLGILKFTSKLPQGGHKYEIKTTQNERRRFNHQNA